MPDDGQESGRPDALSPGDSQTMWAGANMIMQMISAINAAERTKWMRLAKNDLLALMPPADRDLAERLMRRAGVAEGYERLVNAWSRKPPRVIVIGAMKAGTTSIHRYLDLHPEIGMTPAKELNYFSGQTRLDRGWMWYLGQFPPGELTGEVSPNYTKTPAISWVTAERLHAAIPEARLIYLVRDPVQRIWSHYHHRPASHRKRTSFFEFIGGPDSIPVQRTRYASNLEPYLERFGEQQVLVIDSADLLYDRRETLRRVFEFVGVESGFDSPRFDTELRVANKPAGSSPTAEEADLIRELLGEEMRRLRELTGLTFGTWLV